MPASRSLELVLVTFGLRSLRDTFGPDDPLVQAAIGKRSPEDVAREAVEGTHLDDPKTREALWKGGAAAIAASTDPMIALARRLDPQARAIRQTSRAGWMEPSPETGSCSSRRRSRSGGPRYPDATLTLRLLRHHRGLDRVRAGRSPRLPISRGSTTGTRGSFRSRSLPPGSPRARSSNPAMPFDIATTNDVIGGNSGSPLINRNGEVVALIFDGNWGPLGGDYGYDANRAVALHGQAILEGLEKVYGAEACGLQLPEPWPWTEIDAIRKLVGIQAAPGRLGRAAAASGRGRVDMADRGRREGGGGGRRRHPGRVVHRSGQRRLAGAPVLSRGRLLLGDHCQPPPSGDGGGEGAGCRTLAAGYRLAPEHPFPAAFEDALTAWRFLRGQGIAAQDIVIGGDSAGGGLTVALMEPLARRRNGATRMRLARVAVDGT